MKLFIHVNSFEKVVCAIVAFLSREGWVKTCFAVSLWVNHACIFALSRASFTLVQLACSNWVSGSVPLRRGRDNAIAVLWRWPAAVAPRSCSQESGSYALVGRLCRVPARTCWVLNWFCVVSWDTFLTHQRCGPRCGALVCECNGDIDDLYIF